tara:strand:+ start:564 stop:953 length:390 start_codon:yes stop_codon:yes gene_type:complete
MPSAKALGKRKMTPEQIRVYHAKHQRIERYPDSDDESPLEMQGLAMIHANRGHTGVVIHPSKPIHGHAPVHLPVAHVHAQVNVHPDDEHARDLLEALNRSSSIDIGIEAVGEIHDILFSDDLCEDGMEA